MEVTSTYNCFWLIIFCFLAIIIITIGIVISKNIGNKTFTNVFYKSNDNAKDITLHVTDKITETSNNLITVLPKEYEQELHTLESSVKDVNDRLIETAEEINDKLSLLIERVAKLESIEYNKDKDSK